MGVDVDAWRRTHPGWTVTLDGHLYRARPVSARAVVALQPELIGTPVQHLGAIEKLLRLAFPWRVSYVWWGDPVKKIMALEPDAYREVTADFFDRLGLRARHSAPRTSTTASPH